MQIPFTRCLLLAILAGTVSGNLLVNTGFPGNDIERTMAPDVEYCQLICTHHPQCLFFTFLTEDWNQEARRFLCYLKPNVTGIAASPVPLQNATSGYTLTKDVTNLNRCHSKLFPNIEFRGNDYKVLTVPTVAACQDACSRSPDCQFFSSLKQNATSSSTHRFQCFLKFNSLIPSPPAFILQPGVKSGFSQRDCCSGYACSQGCADVIIPGMDFHGSSVTQFQAANVTTCQSACTQNPYCHFFTFNTKDWSSNSNKLICYLRKSDSGIPTGITSMTHVLSGFTKKSTEFQKSEKECADFLLPNVDFGGGDIQHILASDAEHCQRICTQHPQCHFFSFITEEWSQDNRKLFCYLKSTDTKIPKYINPASYIISGFPLTTSGVQKSTKECANTFLPNNVFYGDDIANVLVSDVNECQHLCTYNPRCQFFSAMGSDSYCYHKGNAAGIPHDPRTCTNCSSGFSLRSSGLQKGGKGCADFFIPGVDFYGSDIKIVAAVDAEYCQLLCTHHPGCRFFTFYPKEKNTDFIKFFCFLKGGSSEVPTDIVGQPHAVSGFSFTSPGFQKRCVTESYSDVWFTGYNERTLPVKSYESCQSACTDDPLCQFFSYVNDTAPDLSMRGKCFLKNVMSLPVPNPISSVENITSGFPLRKCNGELPGYSPPLSIEVSICLPESHT